MSDMKAHPILTKRTVDIDRINLVIQRSYVVERSDDLITRIVYPDGLVSEFEYEDQELAAVKFADRLLRRCAGGWLEELAAGGDGFSWKSVFLVQQVMGSFGAGSIVCRNDDLVRVIAPLFSYSLCLDDLGRISSVHYPDGSVSSLHYDDAKLVYVDRGELRIWTLCGYPFPMQQFPGSGLVSLMQADPDINSEAFGCLFIEGVNTGHHNRGVYRPDGTSVSIVTNPEGEYSAFVKSLDGQYKEYRSVMPGLVLDVATGIIMPTIDFGSLPVQG